MIKLLLSLALTSFMMKGEAQPPSSILDGNGNPSPILIELVHVLDLPHDNSFASLLKITQEQWIQKGKERWEYEELYPDKKKQVFPLLIQIGCVEGCEARQCHYDYALVLGGFEPRMKIRLESLVAEWRKGNHFDEVILLAGARPLDPRFENISSQTNTEGALLQNLWDSLDKPADLKEVPVKLLEAPMKIDAQDFWVRPNTADTIELWLSTNPLPGSCLVISSQPFIGYQDCVFKTLVPPSFYIETIGPSAPEDTALCVYLDNLTKWMYQEQIRSKGGS